MKAKIKEQATGFKPLTLEVTFEAQRELEALFVILNNTVITDAARDATGGSLDDIYDAIEEHVEDSSCWDGKKWDTFIKELTEAEF